MKRFSSRSHPGNLQKKPRESRNKVFDEEKESVLDEFMDEPGMTERTEKRADLRQRTAEAIKVAEETWRPGLGPS